jgi:hypothetical protein
VTHSVCSNYITGDAASHLAKVVLEHAVMTEFCGIPLASLRENSITELDLSSGGVGLPGAIVLSKLLPSAAALTSLKCAPAAPKRSLLCQRPLTLTACLSLGSVDGGALPIDELKGTKPTEKIDLSRKGLGVASAIIIASCVKGNSVLKELKCVAVPHSVRFRVSAH